MSSSPGIESNVGVSMGIGSCLNVTFDANNRMNLGGNNDVGPNGGNNINSSAKVDADGDLGEAIVCLRIQLAGITTCPAFFGVYTEALISLVASLCYSTLTSSISGAMKSLYLLLHTKAVSVSAAI